MSTAASTNASTESSNTREKILGAALEIFAERGFEGAKTRDIAERADANLGLIKYYFDSKEKLWQAAVDLSFARLGEAFGQAVGKAAPGGERDQLEAVIRLFVRFAAAHPHFMQLMNDEGKRPGARMRWLVERHVRPLYQAFTAQLERAQELGIAPKVSGASLHYMVVGAAGLIFSQAAECMEVTGIDPTQPEFVEAHADALVQILLKPR